MNDSISEALKEAYASVPDDPILETLELSHELIEESIYIVKDRKPLTAKLENGEMVTFEPVGFAFTLPAVDDSGVPELSITVDNINRVASDFVGEVSESQKPLFVTYRPYLANDLEAPQMIPPLTLQMREVSMSILEVSGSASPADLKNKKFPRELYTRSRFPSLGG